MLKLRILVLNCPRAQYASIETVLNILVYIRKLRPRMFSSRNRKKLLIFASKLPVNMMTNAKSST